MGARAILAPGTPVADLAGVARRDQGEQHPGSLSGSRRSACAEASRRTELEGIRRMSPGERIALALALALGRRQRLLAASRAALRGGG